MLCQDLLLRLGINKFPESASFCRAALGVRGDSGLLSWEALSVLGVQPWIYSGNKGHFSDPSKTYCSNFSFLVTLQGLNN